MAPSTSTSTHWIIIFIENFIQHTTFSSKKAIYRKSWCTLLLQKQTKKYWKRMKTKCDLLILFLLHSKLDTRLASAPKETAGLKESHTRWMSTSVGATQSHPTEATTSSPWSIVHVHSLNIQSHFSFFFCFFYLTFFFFFNFFYTKSTACEHQWAYPLS